MNKKNMDYSSEEIESITGSELSGGDDGMEVDVDDDDDEVKVEGATSSPEQLLFPFQVLSPEQVAEHMEDSIREVNLVLQLPPTTARTLLTHFRWDKQVLLEAYYERDGDLETLFRQARVVNPDQDASRTSMAVAPPPPPPPGGVEDCGICYTQKPSSMMYEMACGHRFCTKCWSDYLTIKIREEGESHSIACAAHDCSILVDDASVLKLVTEPGVARKFQHLSTNSFVECNRLMRWCPAADCTNAIRVEWVDGKAKPVTCSCGHTFCFQCGHNDWHYPVPCDWLKKWLKKCVNDSETASWHWISVNTKECPKCQAPIEKSGGCKHMVCHNENCKVHFCWECLTLWEGHGSSCNNRYEGYEVGNEQEKFFRAAVDRFLFHFQLYQKHNLSLRFGKELTASVDKKMEELQKQHGISWNEVQFLKKAVEVLCKCRPTLMHSYVFAFYLQKGSCQFDIFEENQAYFESATEQLSEYLERQITSADGRRPTDIKQKVEDKCRNCERQRQALLDHVYEGWENGWWLYNGEQ